MPSITIDPCCKSMILTINSRIFRICIISEKDPSKLKEAELLTTKPILAMIVGIDNIYIKNTQDFKETPRIGKIDYCPFCGNKIKLSIVENDEKVIDINDLEIENINKINFENDDNEGEEWKDK